MITLLTTLCLFTTVNTEMSELHVRTVRSGSNVTIKCDQNMDNDNKKYLSWYKQSSGKVPEYVVRSFQGIRYASGSNDGRFTVDEETFDLTINAKNEEDAGLYFCGKVKANVVEFGSGTHLLYQGEKIHHPVTEMVIKTGDSATLQCSVQSLNSNCSGDHSVYWFRHGSGESHPGIIYTHGNRSDECEKSSETDSPTQSCVYKLPKRNLSLSDAGTYYCAVAACGRIVFGNQTKVNVQENNSWIVITLTILNVIFAIVIILLIGVLLKNHRNGTFNSHLSYTDQAEDTKVLNYAALNFAMKPSSSRPPRVKTTQDMKYISPPEHRTKNKTCIHRSNIADGKWAQTASPKLNIHHIGT
ncbi:uncharacterized protein LOC108411026 [Pygocentrus nattereri]|uniref:uncharacterized protein LOC108411026 n=1 Tax=Pygocentrus nattereri TaxID=42514 RepID=UPI0008149996|nr:uncharacterized protein LOC108411026 [Pygocentrus nattereri]